MDDEAAILSAIAAQPAENTPRLAYADWLDDHAAHLPDPHSARIRAEFIRLQCELGKYEHLPSSEQQGYADLYRRQDAILTRHRRDLLGPVGDDITDADVGFDRGFASHLKLDAERFLRHTDTIAALKPPPDVTVRDGAAWLDQLVRFGRTDTISALHMQSERRREPVVPDGSAWAEFVKAEGWPRLRELHLELCGLGDEGLGSIADGSETFPSLVALDVSGNEISDDGVRLLVDSPLWPRLTYLVLGANPISDEGAFALADAPPSRIEYLNLKFTGIDRDGQRRLLRRKGWKVDLF